MEEWINIDTEIKKKKVKSIPRFLKAVVNAKGYPTKQFNENENIFWYVKKKNCKKTFVR